MTGASESMDLAKDSTGQLWVTYTRVGKVFVNRTTGADTSWGSRSSSRVPRRRINSDDTSALVAFGGRQVGVFWSNQKDRAFYFAVHDDTAADDAWRIEVAYGQHVAGCARGCANDHISLKALPDGRVFAAVKTANRQPNLPFIVLLVRSTTGWASHVAGTVKRAAHPAARRARRREEPGSPVHGRPRGGGRGLLQDDRPGRIEFEPGLGDPFISGGGAINNPTSTKQTVGQRDRARRTRVGQVDLRYWYNTRGDLLRS